MRAGRPHVKRKDLRESVQAGHDEGQRESGRKAESSVTASPRAALRRVLPRGGRLDHTQWEQRHRRILVLLWLHGVSVPIYGLVRGVSGEHALLEGMAVVIPALVATRARLPRRVRTLAAAAGLLSSSAVLVHLSGGLIEMHFHFFVMMAVVAMYHDWLPFLLSILYVLVHHGVVGALDPRSVYNHPAAIANPWLWAGVHAFFIAGISAALLTYWRLNETNLAERKRAEQRARREARTVAALNEIGSSLTGDLELSHVVQKVIDAATELTAASFGAFFFNVDDGNGGSYMLYALSGAPREAFERFPMPRNTALFARTFSGEGVVRLDDVTRDPRYGRSGPYYGMPKGHLPVRSYLGAPVISRGQVLGGLFLGHPEPARFSDDDERLAVGIAAHAAAALQAATLFESERRARERLAVLAEASRVLSASLDQKTMLSDLGRMLVPRVADAFVADVLKRGALSRLAVKIDPGIADAASIAFEARPPDLSNEANPIVRAIRTGASQLIEEVPEELLEAAIEDPEYREAVRRIAPTSALVVPLVMRDRILGAFTLGTVQASGRRLGANDRQLAEELAGRAATALETARLFEQQRTTAEVLQHSLLPEELPDLPGMSATARYAAGGAGVEVGGDWYDAVTLKDGSIALVMGDVVGRGVPAASLMGQLKSALRAYSFDGYEPPEVLQRLNMLLLETGNGGQMATLVYCRFDPTTGLLRVANAGHPPPLIVTPEGDARYFDEVSGPPLGALPRARYAEAVGELSPGSLLLLYTDGLLESREVPLQEGMARLLERTSKMRDQDIEVLSDALLESAPARGSDDRALLALRWHALGDRISLQLPAKASTLRPLRALVRRWLRDAGANEQETYEILASLGEATTNVIRHASKPTSPMFTLEVERGRTIRIVVRDRGRWRPPDEARPGGQGLDIMRQFMDSVEINTHGEGTALTLTRKLASAEQPS